ncbi:kinase-like domain-containing protein [Pyrenochaeta sp. MPI-SDFR-AT-0127]|nr:kinase-like domain-containing protein [Pyrenochaeta sp. MPI-SDFR-AT-0127]
MRLLQIQDDGSFSLVEHSGGELPQYAILSHTWGADWEEVNFRDVMRGRGRHKLGWRKIHFCAKQAAKDGLSLIWIDSCCIDKTSSSELTEAINSMFRWYRTSARCYVYLSDVPDRAAEIAFRRSRWFKRGWTLQELLAPRSVEFFSVGGERIGDRVSLLKVIHEATNISLQALQGRPLSLFSMKERMSWTRGRDTKLEEDAVYSLLGIFDIYLPLIYGEGRAHAKKRLIQAIADASRDESSLESSESPCTITPKSGAGSNVKPSPELEPNLTHGEIVGRHPVSGDISDDTESIRRSNPQLVSTRDQSWTSVQKDTNAPVAVQVRQVAITSAARQNPFPQASDDFEFKEVKLLGIGGFGDVHHVVDLLTGREYARKVVIRFLHSTWTEYERRVSNFQQELSRMREVRHRHCVEVRAACTDSLVMLLSTPVAQMNLAQFLDLDLSILQLDFLRRTVGCITSALVYLHQSNMRHDDLKPNNILINGSNVLLCDFGFCSDTATSATLGVPSHYLERYSSPESFGSNTRSQLTDIWGLGCVILEIMSRLRGHKLSTVKQFWRTHGKFWENIAQNTDANTAWLKILTKSQARTQHGDARRDLLLVSFTCHVLLRQDKSLRPTAQQVMDKLQDLDAVYPVSSSKVWIDSCCATQQVSPFLTNGFRWHTPQWPILDLIVADDYLSHIVFDTDWVALSTSDNLSYLCNSGKNRAFRLECLFARNEIIDLRNAAQSMLKLASLQNRQIAQSNDLLHQIMGSISTCRLEDTIFFVGFFNVYLLGMDELPHIRTVQLSLYMTCLKDQPGYQVPFLVMTFDPNEGEKLPVMQFDPEKQKIVPVTTYDPRNPGVPVIQVSHVEGKDVWTDGVTIAGAIFDGEKVQRYFIFSRQVSERQRNFLNLLEKRRTHTKLNATVARISTYHAVDQKHTVASSAR